MPVKFNFLLCYLVIRFIDLKYGFLKFVSIFYAVKWLEVHRMELIILTPHIFERRGFTFRSITLWDIPLL